MSVIKTTGPLLGLTLERMVDQISARAKPSPDEDSYRFFAALLGDASNVSCDLSFGLTGKQWSARSTDPNDDGALTQQTIQNLARFSDNLHGDRKVFPVCSAVGVFAHSAQAAVEKDFLKETPKLREYIKRLLVWRDAVEKIMTERPRSQPLDQGGCNLIEFHHTKFAEIEVPGQYIQVSHSLHSAKVRSDFAACRSDGQLHQDCALLSKNRIRQGIRSLLSPNHHDRLQWHDALVYCAIACS